MKKILIMMVLAAAAMNANAQLVVDSIGRVGVGANSPKSLLSVGDDGNKNTSFYCNSYDRTHGIYIENETDSITETNGGLFHTTNFLGDCNGVKGLVLGSVNTTSQNVIGVSGLAAFSNTAIGVFGGKLLPMNDPVNFAGIYGAETLNSPSFTNYSGHYAGFFNGKVRVTNGIYATVLSPVTSPSPSGQGGTPIVSDRGESVTDKLSRVQALQYLRYDPTKEPTTAKTSAPSAEEIKKMSPEQLDSLAKAMGDVEPEPYLSTIQYGLAADQLKAVYPELVYEDANGNVSINYVEMVPLLVQSINELSAKVAEFESTASKKAKATPTAIEDTASDVDMVRMDQNKPNPFSESTVITLNIPQQAQSASIFIYDMSGKQVQNIAVSERGETNITVYASDLTAGMYIYTLVVDGKVAVTRRMIVTK